MLFVSVFLLSACQTKTEVTKEIVQIPVEKQASDKIEDSFSADGEIRFNKQNTLSIEKSALGKIFLLAPAIVTTAPMQMLEYTQAKTVSFEKNGDQLVVYEQNLQSIYDIIPANQVLQSFPIVKEDNNKIYFKWKLKLSYFQKSFNYAVSDQPEMSNEFLSNKAFDVVNSSVKSISKNNNILEINAIVNVKEQKLKMKEDSNSEDSEKSKLIMDEESSVNSYNILTRIMPYKSNDSFQPMVSLSKGKYGYFEVLRLEKETGKKKYLAGRWDLSPEKGPITYYIGDNIPAEYKEAVISGILYWNKVFGREAIKVETNSEKLYGGYRQAVLHWIPNKSAGFARASMQMDPLTGEIITANVYMTSVFSTTIDRLIEKQQKNNSDKNISTSEYLNKNLKSENDYKYKWTNQFDLLKNNLNAEGRPLNDGISLFGFGFSEECHFNEMDLLNSFNNFKYNEINPELKLALSQDIVRMTVAHEVGHTLGLRHNFAGSLASEYEDVEEQIAAKSNYGLSRKLEKPVTSTVMDYLEPFDDGITGAFIQNQPLNYDKLAIQWGYALNSDERKSAIEQSVLFCTDSEAGNDANKLYGCNRFDSTKYPMQNSQKILYRQNNENLETAIKQFLKFYLFNPDGERKKSNEISSGLTFYMGDEGVNSFFMHFDLISASNQNKSNILKSPIYKKYDEKTGAFLEMIGFIKESSLPNSDFEKSGGLPELLSQLLFLKNDGDFDSEKYRDTIIEKLAKDNIKKGTSIYGKNFELSDTDINEVADALVKNSSGYLVSGLNFMSLFSSFSFDQTAKNSSVFIKDIPRLEKIKTQIENILLLGQENQIDIKGVSTKYFKYNAPSEVRTNAINIYLKVSKSMDQNPITSKVKMKIVENIQLLTGKNLDELNEHQLFALYNSALLWPAEIQKIIQDDIRLYKKLFTDSIASEKEKYLK